MSPIQPMLAMIPRIVLYNTPFRYYTKHTALILNGISAAGKDKLDLSLLPWTPKGKRELQLPTLQTIGINGSMNVSPICPPPMPSRGYSVTVLIFLIEAESVSRP